MQVLRNNWETITLRIYQGFPGGSAGKESTCNAGDLGLIPGLGRSPGERNGSPLQYSGLENSMDRTVHGVTESRTRLSNFYFHFQGYLLVTVVVVELLSHVWLFCNPMDCSLPGPSVHGFLQARILEWVAISFSRGSLQPRDQTCVFCIGRQILYPWTTTEVLRYRDTAANMKGKDGHSPLVGFLSRTTLLVNHDQG